MSLSEFEFDLYDIEQNAILNQKANIGLLTGSSC